MKRFITTVLFALAACAREDITRPLLAPLWTVTLPSTAVPPPNAASALGWSLFVSTSSTTPGGYYATTTADHTLVVVNASQAFSSDATIAWTFAAWADNATEQEAFGAFLAYGNNDEGRPSTLLVLRGSALHVFDLQTGVVLVAPQNILNELGEAPTSLSTIVPASLLMIQYSSSIAVLNRTGALQWSQPKLPGYNVRTGTSSDAPFIALVQAEQPSSGATFGVTALSATTGGVIVQLGYNASEVQDFYMMDVNSDSFSFYMERHGHQTLYRYMLMGYFVNELHVPSGFYGYGIADGVLYLQVGNTVGGLTVYAYDDMTAACLSYSNPFNIPLTVAGGGHLMAEPGFSILTFMTDNDTVLHLTSWNASDGTNMWNYSFPNPLPSSSMSSTTRTKPIKGAHGNTLRYSSDANMMLANWNGQAFVPSTTGFHFLDGSKPLGQSLDDRYKSAFPELVFPATALTDDILVVVSGATVSAFGIL